MCQISGSISKKRRGHLEFCAENMFAQLPCSYLVSAGSTLGAKHDLILALSSQMFEYLRDFFTDMPWSTRNRLVQQKKTEFFLRKRLTIVHLLEGLWSAGTRFRH